MKAIGIKDRVTFVDYYLSPAIELGIVEMTQPDSPRSPTQKYRLTAKGAALAASRDGSPPPLDKKTGDIGIRHSGI